MDLSKMTFADLHVLRDQVEREIKQREQEEVAKARDQIVAIARGVGIPLQELMNNAARIKKRKATNIQYRHPSDASLHWNGQGRRPNWVKDWLASGKSLDTLRT